MPSLGVEEMSGKRFSVLRQKRSWEHIVLEQDVGLGHPDGASLHWLSACCFLLNIVYAFKRVRIRKTGWLN